MKLLAFQAQSGPPSREELVSRTLLANLDSLYSTARRLSGKPDLAEDFVQETARKALQAIPALRDERNIRAWLFKILINILRDHLRRSWSWEGFDAEEEELVTTPNLEDLSQAAAQDVRRAVSRLTPALQSLVILVDLEEFTIAEAAGILKIPFGTAASRLARAHRELRDLLKAYHSKSRQSGGRP